GPGIRRFLPPLRAARALLHVVGLPHERVPPQEGATHRPRAALPGARACVPGLRHRLGAPRARAPLGPRARRLRARALMAVLPAPVADAEDARLGRLRAYGVLDPDQPQPALDELVRRAQEACGAPMAWLSFFDGKRERLRARSGVAFA